MGKEGPRALAWKSGFARGRCISAASNVSHLEGVTADGESGRAQPCLRLRPCLLSRSLYPQIISAVSCRRELPRRRCLTCGFERLGTAPEPLTRGGSGACHSPSPPRNTCSVWCPGDDTAPVSERKTERNKAKVIHSDNGVRFKHSAGTISELSHHIFIISDPGQGSDAGGGAAGLSALSSAQQ